MIDQTHLDSKTVPPARLRLRTVMIVIAALAAVMGAIRFLALQCGVTNVALGFFGSDLCVLIDMVPNQQAAPAAVTAAGGTILIIKNMYAFPLTNFVIPAALVLVVAISALAARHRSNRRRRRPRSTNAKP